MSEEAISERTALFPTVDNAKEEQPRRRTRLGAAILAAGALMLVAGVASGKTRASFAAAPALAVEGDSAAASVEGGPNNDDDRHPCLGKPSMCHTHHSSSHTPAPSGSGTPMPSVFPTYAPSTYPTYTPTVDSVLSGNLDDPAISASSPASAPAALPNKKPTYTAAKTTPEERSSNKKKHDDKLAPTIDDDDPVMVSLHDDEFGDHQEGTPLPSTFPTYMPTAAVADAEKASLSSASATPVPSVFPTYAPSTFPTYMPTAAVAEKASLSSATATLTPTAANAHGDGTRRPTMYPVHLDYSTAKPTRPTTPAPTFSAMPTTSPTHAPTHRPTTAKPTGGMPSVSPSALPTAAPSTTEAVSCTENCDDFS